MKTTLVAVKIILVIMITVSIGSVLGAIGYVASIKNNPVAVQSTVTPTITQILTPTVTSTLTPTITPNIDISDWKTYKNEKYGFEIKYPQDWVYKEDINTVYFGTPESKSGGYIWGISIHQPGELEQLISQTGNQFNDRKEVRDKITLNTNILGTIVTVTTSKYTNWISKKVYFEKDNQLFVIGNGAIIDDRFEIFYKSFIFTNKNQ